MILFRASEADEIEEEIFLCMFLDLFADVMNYFIKEVKNIIHRKLFVLKLLLWGIESRPNKQLKPKKKIIR